MGGLTALSFEANSPGLVPGFFVSCGRWLDRQASTRRAGDGLAPELSAHEMHTAKYKALIQLMNRSHPASAQQTVSD